MNETKAEKEFKAIWDARIRALAAINNLKLVQKKKVNKKAKH